MKRLLDSLKPVDVATYLSARGWRRGVSFQEDKASLWFAPEGEQADVLLPLRSTLGDFTLRMGQLVSEVARIEGRSEQDVLRDVAAVNGDVLRIRIIMGDGKGANLPLIDGVNLLKKTRDVLVAAALATVEKRPYFTNRRSETILEFLEHLQLGQTEYSSFVFTVVSPLGEADGSRSGKPAKDAPLAPFARRVMQTLMHALDAMEEAADAAAREGNVKPFLRAVQDGVSANLCDAVVELKSICPSCTVEFSVAWAATHGAPDDRIDRVVLRQDSIPYIEEASDAFWGMPKQYDFRLEGVVRELETPEPAAGDGTAVLMGYVDGKPVDVRARFDARTYAEVAEAHRERAIVCCEGDLIRENGVYTLKNTRYFRILQSAAGS